MKNILLPFAGAIVALSLACSVGAVETTCAKPQTLIDARADRLPTPPIVREADRSRVARDVFGADALAITINGRLDGAFTAPGARETLYLVQKGGPDAIAPGGQSATLAIYAGDVLLHSIETRSGNFLQQRLAAIGSGVDAIVLRADTYQMAIAETQFVLVDLAGGKLTERARFEAAVVNACDDARFGGTVEAITVTYCAGADRSSDFQTTRYRGACVGKQPPAAAAFKRITESR